MEDFLSLLVCTVFKVYRFVCVYACVHVLISMAKPRSERLPFLDLSVFLPTHDQI